MDKLVFLICYMFCSGIIWQTKAKADIAPADSIQINKKVLRRTIAIESAYYLGTMAVMQNTWYRDKELVPFHFYNDNKGYLQVDKLGHAFGSYVESYIGYKYFLKAGLSKKQALLYGASLGLILQTPIEIMDGIHEGWGFSWGDMAANAFGSGLVAGQELLFNEQVVKYKFSYSESVYSRNSNNYYGKTQLNRLLKDYNGHTYWLSMPLNRLVRNNKLPAWLSISAGYSANGMYGEYKNISEFEGVTIPETERYRQYLFSFDIDWTRIKTNSKIFKIVFQGLTFIKLPFPAIECNSKGNIKGYWLYF